MLLTPQSHILYMYGTHIYFQKNEERIKINKNKVFRVILCLYDLSQLLRYDIL